MTDPETTPSFIVNGCTCTELFAGSNAVSGKFVLLQQDPKDQLNARAVGLVEVNGFADPAIQEKLEELMSLMERDVMGTFSEGTPGE